MSTALCPSDPSTSSAPFRPDPPLRRREPTPLSSSLLTTLALVSLARNNVACDKDQVSVLTCGDVGRGHSLAVQIRLGFSTFPDELREGAKIAQLVHEDMARFGTPVTVRIQYA